MLVHTCQPIWFCTPKETCNSILSNILLLFSSSSSSSSSSSFLSFIYRSDARMERANKNVFIVVRGCLFIIHANIKSMQRSRHMQKKKEKSTKYVEASFRMLIMIIDEEVRSQARV